MEEAIALLKELNKQRLLKREKETDEFCSLINFGASAIAYISELEDIVRKLEGSGFLNEGFYSAKQRYKEALAAEFK